MSCPLCKHDSVYFGTYQGRIYNRCTFCASVFLDPNDLPSAKAEKKRYDKHENSLDNKGYLQFLEPLRNAVVKNESATLTGLDYGCGPNPVLSKLLKKEGFTVKQYDIYYHNEASVLQETYDYIVCCEVIEHFHNPYEAFAQLKSLLKPKNSKLYCKTALLQPEQDFESWAYKNDFTHSFFYSEKALQFLKEEFQFSELVMQPDYFILET